MKRILAFFIAFTVTGAICFAQQSPVSHKLIAPAAVKTVQVKILIGVVKSIVAADPAKGTGLEVVVVDEKSAEHVFVIKATTTIYDVDFKASSIDKIKANDKVKVKYSIKEGVNEATSITVVK
jgi:hypothetical protein